VSISTSLTAGGSAMMAQLVSTWFLACAAQTIAGTNVTFKQAMRAKCSEPTREMQK
jgi:dipeptide/tripeptide permease